MQEMGRPGSPRPTPSISSALTVSQHLHAASTPLGRPCFALYQPGRLLHSHFCRVFGVLTPERGRGSPWAPGSEFRMGLVELGP